MIIIVIIIMIIVIIIMIIIIITMIIMIISLCTVQQDLIATEMSVFPSESSRNQYDGDLTIAIIYVAIFAALGPTPSNPILQ